eukprot:ANDGO_01735.mRNA.1 Eukaryotic translation initiation factor 4E-4
MSSRSNDISLSDSYSFYFNSGKSVSCDAESGSGSLNPYEAAFMRLCQVATVGEFWTAWSHIHRPEKLGQGCDLAFFRGGVKPVWEHPANAQGGKWSIRLRKQGFAKHILEDLMIALIGNMLPEGVLGIVYSSRPYCEVVSVWNSDAQNKDACSALRSAIVARTGIPPRLHLEYKPHDDSLRRSTLSHSGAAFSVSASSTVYSSSSTPSTTEHSSATTQS